MVSNYVLGMTISALVGVTGTLLMAYINVVRTKLEQKAENKRVRAEALAEMEADLIQELGISLEESHRVYETAVRKAACNGIDVAEYESDIEQQYLKFLTTIEEAMAFLDDDGETALRQYLNELIGADMYVQWKANQGRPIEEKHPAEALREEELPPDINFDWERFHESHQLAKEGLRYDVRKRMKPLKESDS